MRYVPFALVIALTIFLVLVAAPWWLLLPFVALVVLGLIDLNQQSHSLTRNYPLIGHLRSLAEAIRDQVQQYFVESDTDGRPFDREQRSLVYQRAKSERDTVPFGTERDVNGKNYRWINHTMMPTSIDPASLRVRIGGSACEQPYEASLLNISAMSFGSLGANAIGALNRGAKLGGFAHDTGEGGLSRYHLEQGGDLIWEIGSGYFGCRDANGQFCPEKFASNAAKANVKMIEVKLSQGAKPGHGGVLPGAKVNGEIARARGVPEGVDCISPARHSAFSTPQGLIDFLADLRRLSGGKPVGFKFCLGHKAEFLAVVKAMCESGVVPDFIVVDGKEGGTGAAPVEFTDHVGTPLVDALHFVHQALTGAGIRDQVKVAASGKVVSAFDMAVCFALGADWCNSARGFMLALGCLQSKKCHTNHCPVGIATQDPVRQRGLVVEDKSQRVANYHGATMHALAELIGAAGYSSPEDFSLDDMGWRHADDAPEFSRLWPALEPGALVSGHAPEIWQSCWTAASAETFVSAAVSKGRE